MHACVHRTWTLWIFWIAQGGQVLVQVTMALGPSTGTGGTRAAMGCEGVYPGVACIVGCPPRTAEWTAG